MRSKVGSSLVVRLKYAPAALARDLAETVVQQPGVLEGRAGREPLPHVHGLEERPVDVQHVEIDARGLDEARPAT